MSNRERWTVYPLLFLTLGIALKDKITKQTDTDTVFCKSLVVTNRQRVPQVVVSSSPAGGIVQANGRETNVLLGHHDKLGGLWFTDAKGNLLAVGGVIPAAALNQPPGTDIPQAPAGETTQPRQEPEQEAGGAK